MIRILIKKDSDIKQIIVSGHADSAPYGQDLVCCAVSVLVQSSINGIILATENEDFFSVDEKNGRIIINNFSTEDSIKSIKKDALIDSLLYGLEDLYKNNREFIDFKIEEV